MGNCTPAVHLRILFDVRKCGTSRNWKHSFCVVLQGASSPDPSQVYVDMRALRNDRVTLVERGAPHSLCLLESGKLLPGVKVVIANPDTKGQCGDSHLGEVCLCSSLGHPQFGHLLTAWNAYVVVCRFGCSRHTMPVAISQYTEMKHTTTTTLMLV